MDDGVIMTDKLITIPDMYKQQNFSKMPIKFEQN